MHQISKSSFRFSRVLMKEAQNSKVSVRMKMDGRLPIPDTSICLVTLLVYSLSTKVGKKQSETEKKKKNKQKPRPQLVVVDHSRVYRWHLKTTLKLWRIEPSEWTIEREF